MSLTIKLNRAIQLFRTNRYSEAYRIFEDIYKEQPIPSVLFMARILNSGKINGGNRDQDKTIELLKPFKHSNGHAAFLLFDLYHRKGDCEQAMACIYSSAKQKFAPAYYRLGQIFYFGYCVEKSLEEAVANYKLGADEGHIWCKIYYSKNLLLGRLGLKFVPVGIFELILSLISFVSEMRNDLYSDNFID